jgi:hypothetical protein
MGVSGHASSGLTYEETADRTSTDISQVRARVGDLCKAGKVALSEGKPRRVRLAELESGQLMPLAGRRPAGTYTCTYTRRHTGHAQPNPGCHETPGQRSAHLYAHPVRRSVHTPRGPIRPPVCAVRSFTNPQPVDRVWGRNRLHLPTSPRTCPFLRQRKPPTEGGRPTGETPGRA